MSSTVSTLALGFCDDVFDVFLDEAERALIDVDGRTDEPNRRVHQPDARPESTGELRLAIAELTDAYPGIQFELEALSERLRSVGVREAAVDLEARPHVVQLVRLSLEVFFRAHPTAESFELALHDEDEVDDEDAPAAGDVWEANRQLLDRLRGWVS